MPYLPENFKYEIERQTYHEAQKNYASTLDFKDFLGYLNYIVFGTVQRWLTVNGRRYFHFAGIIGTLVCCVLELYRRKVSVYEDEAIVKNGDV